MFCCHVILPLRDLLRLDALMGGCPWKDRTSGRQMFFVCYTWIPCRCLVLPVSSKQHMSPASSLHSLQKALQALHGGFHKQGGPNRHQYSMFLILRTPEKGLPCVGNPPTASNDRASRRSCSPCHAAHAYSFPEGVKHVHNA